MRVRMASALITAVAMLALTSGARAHEGHGNPSWYGSILHYLLEPLHVPLTLAALVALVLAWRWVSKKLSQRTARLQPSIPPGGRPLRQR